MTRMRSYMLSALGLFAASGMLALTTPRAVRSGPVPPPQQVLVVNSAAQPVPTAAQGTTNIAGTVQSRQNGNWNVGIVGTPSVGISPTANTVKVDNTSPLVVRKADEPALNAFRHPDAVAERLRDGRRDLSQRALEALAVDAYRSGEITAAQVQEMLHLSSRWETDAFLKERGAYLRYGAADLEADLQTFRRVTES